MTTNNELNTRLIQLDTFEKSENYSNIINTLDNSYDLHTNLIIQKWTSNQTLSNDEQKYLDLYSKIQLSYVKYCFFNSNIVPDVQNLIEKFRSRLFQKTQTDTLTSAVEFIREQQPNNTNENDIIFVYIMRMIDARSFAYKLCFKDISPPRKLNDELKECLQHRHAKNYLYYVKSTSETNQTISINYLHQFFIGCTTFATASYENNKDILDDNERNNKYICVLIKYIRIILNEKNFEKNPSIIYCLRGSLALLTNCVPFEYWLTIINQALAEESNEDAQKKNPFNTDLFQLIINKLLASKYLQKKTVESSSNDETLLVDTALVFLVKWSDTQRDISDENEDNNNPPSISDQPNQVLRCLRSDESFKNTVQIIVPYIDAKYDRVRLMAVSILSNLMNNQDFEDLKNQKINMGKDLVKLIFDFSKQAAKQPNSKYKGISFDLLLCYLLRFLVQDFIKDETLPYIPQIVDYAKNRHIYALKILRKISTNPKLREDLSNNPTLKQFLGTDANIIFEVSGNMYKIIEDIRQNLAPPPKITEPTPSDNENTCQAFISYCHEDQDSCKSIHDKLHDAALFTKIWIDKKDMIDNMYETVAKAIKHSKIVLVLLSDKYCESDFCRREWTFALAEKIKTYVIFVQNDFDKSRYDWARFQIGVEKYYKMHKNDDLQQLIDNIRDTLNGKMNKQRTRRKSTSKPKPSSLPPPPPPPPSTENILTDNGEYSKRSVAKWTSEDVQRWCKDNHLNKWCEPLTNFDGQNLLQLHEDLSKQSYASYAVEKYDLNGFDITRFKCELDQLLSKSTTKQKPPTKQYVTKRRTSKSSNK